MRAQIEVLREVFEEWLRIHEIHYDFRFYTPDEWAAKEGTDHRLQGAELMLAFENDLVTWLNFGTDIPDELQDLAEGFGYFYELGHTWNMGFYPIEDWQSLPPASTSYSEKLQDPRWQRKRARIVERSASKCEECGLSSGLDVHHCYYRYGREPWQYPDTALLALCRNCHKLRAEAEMDFRLFQQSLRTEELRDLQAAMSHCKYWYDSTALQAFLRSLPVAPGHVPTGAGAASPEITQSQHERLRFTAQYGELCEKLYPSLQPEGFDYLKRSVKLEFGSLTDQQPVGWHPIRPWMAEALPEAFEDWQCQVVALEVERTFWEKATILHTEYHRPADKTTPDRFSRHYADVAALAKHQSASMAIDRHDIRDRVVQWKSQFFGSAWANYEAAKPGTFRIVPPPERLPPLRRDYQAMRDMYLTEPASFDDTLATLADLENRINQGGGK